MRPGRVRVQGSEKLASGNKFLKKPGVRVNAMKAPQRKIKKLRVFNLLSGNKNLIEVVFRLEKSVAREATSKMVIYVTKMGEG